MEVLEVVRKGLVGNSDRKWSIGHGAVVQWLFLWVLWLASGSAVGCSVLATLFGVNLLREVVKIQISE